MEIYCFLWSIYRTIKFCTFPSTVNGNMRGCTGCGFLLLQIRRFLGGSTFITISSIQKKKFSRFRAPITKIRFFYFHFWTFLFSATERADSAFLGRVFLRNGESWRFRFLAKAQRSRVVTNSYNADK